MYNCEDCGAYQAEIKELEDSIRDLENDRDAYRQQYEKLSDAIGEIACPISDAMSYLAQADKAADKARGI